MQRTVSFYKFYLKKNEYKGDNENGWTTAKSLVSSDNIFAFFKQMYASMEELSTGNRAGTINYNDVDRTIEFYNFDELEKTVCAKICRTNDKNAMMVRNDSTLESRTLSVKDDEKIEIYTYCYIDFKTQIISYIHISGAPRVKTIQRFVNKQIEENGLKYFAELSCIMTKDMLPLLCKKDTIGKINWTVTVPKDDILNELLGGDRSSFDNLYNVKYCTISWVIKAERGKNLFKQPSSIEKFIESLKSRHSNSKITANAKNGKEKVRKFDIDETQFTAIIELKADNNVHSELNDDDFAKALRDTFILNKSDLMEFIA